VLCEYVGHTTNWDKRKASHKQCCNDEKNKDYKLKLYEVMRENGGFNNWKMILVEDYPCKSKREAEQREQYHMDLLVEKLNTNRAFQTRKQILEEVKEKAKEKEIIKEKAKEYYKQNKDKIKEYYQQNKDKAKEKAKEYRQQNKDKIKVYRTEKLVCECEVICSRKHMATHKKSKQHLTYIEGSAPRAS
jgi:hypothetical protein